MARRFAKVWLTGANKAFSYLPSRRSFISAALASVSVLALRPAAQTRTIKLKDYGLKEIHTTGSMAAGSNVLSLPAATWFKLGDHVIVAVGGETGKGMRGTAGVGGTWPKKSYSTVSNLLSDGSQPLNTFAWAQATGDVYQWLGSGNGGWVQQSSTNPDFGTYYTNKAVPKALLAKITGISNGGKTLTLSARAAVATTNANVHYDNQYAFNACFSDPLLSEGVSVYVPPGRYAIGDQIYWGGGTGNYTRDNWTLFGDSADTTVIGSPAGAPSAMFLIEQCTNPVVENLALLGNAYQNKFGLAWGPLNPQVGETYLNQGWMFPSGFLFHQCSGGTAQNLKITNVFQNAVAGSFTDGLQATNCAVELTDPIRQYVQWFFQCADTTVGGTFTDCSINSAYLVPGFEGFRSQNVHYIRPVGVNATMSMNDVGGFLIQDANLSFTSLCQFDEQSCSADNPIVNINSNIGTDYVSQGGTISGMVMNQQGYINAGHSSLLGINVNDQNANVTINGTSYTAPDYKAPTRWANPGPYGVTSSGANTLLENFTVVGRNVGNPNYSPNIGLFGPNHRLINCTAGLIYQS